MRVAAVFIASLFSAHVFAENLVGMVVPPYPQGLIQLGSNCVSGGLGDDHICDYGFEFVVDFGRKSKFLGFNGRSKVSDLIRGKPQFLLAQKLISKSNEEISWLITDSIIVTKLPKDYFWQTSGCQVGGKADDTIIAVVKDANSEGFMKALSARRLDLKTGKFITIPSANIRCEIQGE